MKVRENIQLPRAAHTRVFLRHWPLNVQCSMWLLLSATVLHAQSNTLPTLVPAYHEIPSTFWERHKLLVVAGIALFVAAQFFTLYRVLMRMPSKVQSPADRARTALSRLQDEPEDGNTLSVASQILRGYVGAKLGFPGGELTTAEFIAALARTNRLEIALGESLSSFLRECDVRKFSPTSRAAPLEAVSRALEFITRIEQQTAILDSK